MNANIGHIHIRANKGIIHIRIHIIHIMHFARINCSSVSPVFVLRKYTFPLLSFCFRCHVGLGQAEVGKISYANHVLEAYILYCRAQ
jgi:hypothetical protein